MQTGSDLIVPLMAIGALIFLLLVIFIVSRYRVFKPNEYVIHLRRGKVKRANTGGSAIVLPVFDEIVRIPTTVQQTLLEARERVVSHEYQDLSITAFIYWRVINPEIAYAKVSWDPIQSDFVEKVIKNAAESIIRTTCANMPIEQIIRERNEIIKTITSELHQLMADWGITTESVEIRDVEVLDHMLKENLEANKKIAEEQKARLRRAEMEELTNLRNLERDRKTGIEDQEVKTAVQRKEKEREIQVIELEQRRAIIEAETRQRQAIIAAEAEKARRIAQEIDVEMERMTREAEARKIQLLAQAEGEASLVREKLTAEAEGFLEQVKALQQADDRYVQLKTLEILPEIYKGVKVDQMMILGEGQEAFKSIAQLVLPFMNIVKQMSQSSDTKKK
ncbi:MAG: SPFH domain-containing protein [Candidatus Hodarchaeales archaeon]|jgi:regulator of protease activity HflC (stomatin/prohibitin superfamily)